jgi:hypothetical protein
MVERLMVSKWEKGETGASKPTPQEIRIEWFRMLEFYPMNQTAFESFVNRFPLEDRKKISFRPYTGSRVRTRSPFFPIRDLSKKSANIG